MLQLYISNFQTGVRVPLGIYQQFVRVHKIVKITLLERIFNSGYTGEGVHRGGTQRGYNDMGMNDLGINEYQKLENR